MIHTHSLFLSLFLSLSLGPPGGSRRRSRHEIEAETTQRGISLRKGFEDEEKEGEGGGVKKARVDAARLLRNETEEADSLCAHSRCYFRPDARRTTAARRRVTDVASYRSSFASPFHARSIPSSFSFLPGFSSSRVARAIPRAVRFRPDFHVLSTSVFLSFPRFRHQSRITKGGEGGR